MELTHKLFLGHYFKEGVAPNVSLISRSGRILAVAAATAIDLYDLNEAVSLSQAGLGPGTCKLRLLRTYNVADISSVLAIRSIEFIAEDVLAAVLCTEGGIGEPGRSRGHSL